MDEMPEYHLLTLLASGVYANTFIEGSVASWVTRNREKNIVVLNSWPISPQEYYAFINQ